MKYKLACEYCGKHWEQSIWSEQDLIKLRCEVCQETRLIKVSKIQDKKTDIFGYRFSPEFKEPVADKEAQDKYDYQYLYNGD